VDKVSGLAFHISPDGRSYYALAVVMPGSEVYERWLAPRSQEDTLSATYIAEKNMFATGDPMLALVRVDNGIVTPLRRVRERGVSAGMWVELQVKITGNLIQGALSTGNNGIYTGANDLNLRSGAIGLITDHSLGAFKNLTIWNKPQMIRDLWTIGK
jgi:hypothetical protein